MRCVGGARWAWNDFGSEHVGEAVARDSELVPGREALDSAHKGSE